MKQRMRCFLIIITIILQIISSLASHDVFPQQQGTVPAFSGVNFDSKQGGVESRMVGRLGSRPPNCERKCGGCRPCVATQIPATTDKLGTQYTNYEPEGWKCKCGSTFFTP
ncbi:epidermal patterning factor like 3 [Hibiscus trionum]|uniref:Epidermal patterning factor-like protein n=1 Tax=Hibiscus trionum TaxID=183268 RepID=A0A9W7LXB5_HIBTR|nr:epidermal patterning factor like 3 [Hibiscus trionum]